jgi:NTE family protein
VLGARSNLVPVRPLRQLVLSHVDGERLEDLPMPLHVVACDMRTRDKIRLTAGPLIDAVLRSGRG